MDTTLFSNRLLHVPLFQGFSRLDFLDIVEKIPFDFRTLQPRQYLVKQGDECHGLCVLLSGEVETECESADHTYTFHEHIIAPWTVQIESLFGYHNRYAKSVRAQTETHALLLEKQNVRRMLVSYPAFQINFYNALSTVAQTEMKRNWKSRPTDLAQCFLSFVENRSIKPIGTKRISIRMTDLAQQLGATRLRVSQMLAELAEKGVVDYSRGMITIPHLEQLQTVLLNTK